jgi:hypothetical protein
MEVSKSVPNGYPPKTGLSFLYRIKIKKLTL